MILVTGGTGLLGSKLLEKLVNGGHKVRALKRNTSRLDKVLSIQDKVEWVEGDVLDIPSLEDLMHEYGYPFYWNDKGFTKEAYTEGVCVSLYPAFFAASK